MCWGRRGGREGGVGRGGGVEGGVGRSGLVEGGVMRVRWRRWRREDR